MKAGTHQAAIVTACILAVAWGCAPSEPAADEVEVASEATQPLKLYVMNCGELTVEDVSMFNLTLEEAGTQEMFVPCYLIDHPDGKMLWDLGLPATVKTGEYAMPGGNLTLERTVEEQLADLELTKDDIDYVAVSHLHFDHCGQLNEFAGSHQILQKAEYEAAFAEEMEVPVFEPALYEGIRDSEKTIIDGDHDVFGDGRVVIKSAPGHTPGHQVLFLDLAETGPLLLSGDLYHFPANRELRRPPTFNVDAEQTLESMTAVEAFLEESGATLWIEHDANLAATLVKSPEFYQ